MSESRREALDWAERCIEERDSVSSVDDILEELYDKAAGSQGTALERIAVALESIAASLKADDDPATRLGRMKGL